MLLPGLLLALATGLRGWTAVAVAPLLTFVLVTIAIVVSGVLDLRWTPPTVGAIAAVVVVLAAAAGASGGPGAPPATGPARRSRGDGSNGSRRPGEPAVVGAGVAGVVAGAVIGMVTVLRGTGGLRTPNQGFDALFHVNAVEMITDSRDGGPGHHGHPERLPGGHLGLPRRPARAGVAPHAAARRQPRRHQRPDGLHPADRGPRAGRPAAVVGAACGRPRSCRSSWPRPRATRPTRSGSDRSGCSPSRSRASRPSWCC